MALEASDSALPSDSALLRSWGSDLGLAAGQPDILPRQSQDGDLAGDLRNRPESSAFRHPLACVRARE